MKKPKSPYKSSSKPASNDQKFNPVMAGKPIKGKPGKMATKK